MNNFFGFPKPRKAGFGSTDIPSGDVPLDTTNEDVVLEGIIVDFGEADHKVNLGDHEPGLLDPFKVVSNQVPEFVSNQVPEEDINAFLRRMMGIGSSDLPGRYTQDDLSGTVLVEDDVIEDKADAPFLDVSEPTAESAESVEDMLNVMGSENEKLQNFIDDAMKNIKR